MIVVLVAGRCVRAVRRFVLVGWLLVLVVWLFELAVVR